LEEVRIELEDPDVWNNPEKAQQLGKQRAQLEAVVNGLDSTARSVSDAAELLELAELEQDESTIESISSDLEESEKIVAELEFHRMFSG
jgi:peptide chain release factor 2